MNKCPNCKAELVIDHAFCPKCGFDLRVKKIDNSSGDSKVAEDAPEISEVLELTPPPLPESDIQPENNLIENNPRKQGMFVMPFLFDGRIRRTEYGISFLIYVIVATFVNAIFQSGEAPIIGLAYIPMLWFLWAQGAKRCHDLGNSGWFQIIPFYVLWLIFADGDKNINEYGRNPKN